MNELQIKILREIKANQLLLLDDPETKNHLVFLRVPGNSKISYNINLNGGELILGLDGNHRINSLELNLSKKDWATIEDKLLKPRTTVEGCVEFTNVNSRHNELSFPLTVQTDKLYSAIKIDIGINKTQNPIWIPISDKCFVEIVDNHLCGFWIDINLYKPEVG